VHRCKDTNAQKENWIQNAKMCCGNKCKAAQKQMLKKKIHGYRCNLFPDTNVNEKLWIHKCKDSWKQIQKCMKAKCKDEFMDTNSKIFGYKWENAKMHGLQNVKVFMDTKMQRFMDMGMETNICKDAQKQMQRKIHGYKNTQDFWIRMQRHMDAKCKYSWIRKCQDAWIQMQGFKDTKMQRC
jgi:hypothetical protein